MLNRRKYVAAIWFVGGIFTAALAGFAYYGFHEAQAVSKPEIPKVVSQKPALSPASAPGAVAPPQSPEPAAPLEQQESIAIEVSGAVQRPGLYYFSSGARLHEAVAQAGGATVEADLSDINLAAKIVDARALVIPRKSAARIGEGVLAYRRMPTARELNPPVYTRSGWLPVASEPAAATVRSGGQTGQNCVDLNTATQQDLEGLPGIGPVIAARIVQYRSESRFTCTEDLMYVQGIAVKRFEAIAELVCVTENLQ